ncbi:U32 family peptidase [Candidatus Woesearchaeota archaeon]|nr:U32 family peptidase [Candidatus Woesearchaeota archaeon]
MHTSPIQTSQTNPIPKLLSPVGGWDTLIAAVQNGADAVYLGTKLFNARRLAGNFGKEELIKAIQYAHIHHVEVYITLNTLIKNNEITPFLNQLSTIYQAGADAVILQDLTFAPIIKKHFPQLKVHASTQATIMNTPSVQFWEPYTDVVVLARELTKEQIKNIHDHTTVPLETFVHGHLCSSYSGQCLISSLIGKRSGNRGLCASACRKPYNGNNYLISAKDLCLIKSVKDLANSGIHTLKIEGRMKPAEYVATTTRYYRKQLDALKKKTLEPITEKTITDLKLTFNREFTTGYFNNEKSIIDPLIPTKRGIYIGTIINNNLRLLEDIKVHDGIAFVKDGENSGDFVREIYRGSTQIANAQKGDVIRLNLLGFINGAKVFLTFKHEGEDLRGPVHKIPFSISMKIKQDQEPEITIKIQNKIIHPQQTIKATKALKHPLTKEELETEMRKYESSIFELEHIDVTTDTSFIPKSILTNLRKQLDEHMLTQLAPPQRPLIKVEPLVFPKNASTTKVLHVRVYNCSDVEQALRAGAEYIYYDVYAPDAAKASALCKGKAQFYLVTPMVATNEDVEEIQKRLATLKYDGLLVNNYAFLNSAFKGKKILGYQMNIFNDNQLSFYNIPAIASIELNKDELAAFSQKDKLLYFTHGFPVVMTFREEMSERKLTDHKNYSFALRHTGSHATEMLYSKEIGILQYTPEILNAGITQLFLDLNHDVFEITSIYKQFLDGKRPKTDKFKGPTTVGNLLKGVM